MRSAVVATVIVLATAPWLSAQQQQPPPAPPTFPPSTAPAALTVPNPLAGLQPGPRDLYQRPDGTDRFQQLPPHQSRPPVFFGPGVVAPGMMWPGAYWPFGHRHRAQRPIDIAQSGGLRLETLPPSAQVFVDGYYVGTAEEFGLVGRPLDLPVGAHHVEVRAPGYQTLTFRVLVNANDTIRYRGDMVLLARQQSSAPATASPPPPASPQTVYVIPNCFAGNRPPSRPLPAGCDRSKLQTRK